MPAGRLRGSFGLLHDTVPEGILEQLRPSKRMVPIRTCAGSLPRTSTEDYAHGEEAMGRRGKAIVWLVGLGVVLARASFAADGSMSCDGDLVRIGMPEVEVVTKCGEPTSRSQSLEETGSLHLGNDGARRFVNVSRWTYNRGSGQLLRFLTFKDGSLIKIETGDYGF
jgi:hypothetical protein